MVLRAYDGSVIPTNTEFVQDDRPLGGNNDVRGMDDADIDSTQ